VIGIIVPQIPTTTTGKDSTTQVLDGFIAVDDSQDRKSLGLLARSCLDALEKLGPISMTRLTAELRMVKRRIYDVSNILEGVGIIEKGQRNMVRLTNEGEIKRKHIWLASDLTLHCCTLHRLWSTS
jgi:hypothetical protein